MRRLIQWSVLLVCGLAHAKSLGIYYGAQVPVHELTLFNTVVVDPVYVPSPKLYETDHSHWHAYVSVGEVNRNRNYVQQIKPGWVKGENKAWNSLVIDQTNPKWHAFFINQVLKPLWDSGYRHFFFDTMDSYHQIASSDADKKAQQEGLIKLIRMVKQRYPKAHIILNRGFEIIPAVYNLVDGVAAESLYAGYNLAKKSYQPVAQADRDWLLQQLNRIKKLGLSVYVIDYLPPERRKEAKRVVDKIIADGFTPYVSDIRLNALGSSSIEVMPREVMIFYSSKEAPIPSTEYSLVYYAAVLNYLGYVPKLYDIEKPLPLFALSNRAAGTIFSFSSTKKARSVQKRLNQWVKQALVEKIPIIFSQSMNDVFADEGLMLQLGLTRKPSRGHRNLSWQIKDDALIGYEVEPVIKTAFFQPLIAKNSKIALGLKNAKGQLSDVVAITPWGGYALSSYAIRVLPNGQARYIINPFIFLQKALRLKTIPVPDVTTELGRRILIAHIDGDAFHSKSEWFRGPYAGESLLKTILDKYRIPTTVSIVEGEIGPKGVDPKNSPELMAVARKIFELPWVEIASHSYSHPFFWWRAVLNANKKGTYQASNHLDIPRYRFNLKREIFGSVAFINQSLAPPGKKCKIFLWTGDTCPTTEALRLSYEAGLLNMNGGDTLISHLNPSLTAVSGLGANHGDLLQVFAPIQNENIYTNLWQGPFYGFKTVIETFERTDKPRRLKPIDIYYHFYSATKEAALHALDVVYDWSLKQEVTPEYASEYIRKVLDFYSMAIAKVDGKYLICGNGEIKTFRIEKRHGRPQLSNDVVGYNQVNDSYYAHTTATPCRMIDWTTQAPSEIYLQDANGILDAYEKKGSWRRWRIHAYVPLIAQFANAKHCRFELNSTPFQVDDVNGLKRIALPKKGRYDIQANC